MQLGKAIKRLREEGRLTQLELAVRLNVTNVTVCNWETGTRFPSLDRIEEIASVLGARPAELFMDAPEARYYRAGREWALMEAPAANPARERIVGPNAKDNSHVIERPWVGDRELVAV